MTKEARYRLVRKRVSSLKPSPENTQLYRDPLDDPDISKLAASIKRNGCEPLTVTKDNFIVSGHRRHAALEEIGQSLSSVECFPFRGAIGQPMNT